jgi:hypothetical protein
MQVLSEWGWPAALLLAGLGLWLAWRVLGMLRTFTATQPPPLLRLGLCLSLVALATHSLLSGVLVVPAGQMAVALCGGWLLGLQGSRGGERPGKAGGWLLLPALVLALLLALTAGQEYQRLQQYFADSGSRPPDSPRLWQTGHICQFGQ